MAEPDSALQSQTDAWRRLRLECSRSDFERAHPYPFLVRVPGPRGGDPLMPAKALPVSFHTVIQPQRAPAFRPSIGPAGLGTPELASDGLLVFPVRKSPDNPFPDRISLGRAPNCDVSIRDGSISKLHGHFRDVTPSSAVFVDAKSANGTRVDGALLEPAVPCALAAPMRIAFGRVRVELLSAGLLYDLL